MLNQQSLRRRLKSVKNILNITQAMEVVSGVRFRKLMQKMEHFRAYSSKMSEIVAHLKQVSDVPRHPLMVVRPAQRIAVIVVASDKGLCGSYNEHIFKAANKFLAGYSADQVELYLFGHKAADRFKRSPWKIAGSTLDYSRKLTEESVKEWSKNFATAFEKQEFDELWVVYTHFKNVISREIRTEKILPLDVSTTSPSEHIASPISILFEPDPLQIYQKLIPLSFYVKMLSLLLDAYAAELSCRIIAMKAAAKNAEEMIDKLTLLKNKSRQLSITTEILEITAGAEGIK